jgi:hypothetical protein
MRSEIWYIIAKYTPIHIRGTIYKHSGKRMTRSTYLKASVRRVVKYGTEAWILSDRDISSITR